MRNISRRDLFKIGGTAAVGVAGAGMLASCAPRQSAGQGATTAEASSAEAAGTGTETTSMPAFLAKPEAVVEFAETKDYDVVVVGAHGVKPELPHAGDRRRASADQQNAQFHRLFA